MKNLLYVMAVSLLLVCCEEDLPKSYEGNNFIQFANTSVATFDWKTTMKQYDTLWLDIQSMGRLENFDRAVALVQDTAKGYDLVYDAVGNVVDTSWYVIPNQAQVNKHYIPFDNSSLAHLMMMPAGKSTALIPIVMVKDPTNTKTLTLKVHLEGKGLTVIGDPAYRSKTIQIVL